MVILANQPPRLICILRKPRGLLQIAIPAPAQKAREELNSLGLFDLRFLLHALFLARRIHDA
jgi:hypothetical protein